MTWLQAWLIWSLDEIIFLLVLASIVLLVAPITRMIRQYDKRSVGFKLSVFAHRARMFIYCLIITCLLVTGVCLPSTKKLFKIVATKYGVDAVTSGEAKKKLEKVNKLVDTGLDALDKKIKDLTEPQK